MIRDKFTGMSRGRKSAFAITLAIAVAGTSFNAASIATEASNSREGRVITAFEELPEETAHQYLPVGSKYSDIEFPDELGIFLYSSTETEEDVKKREKKESSREREEKEEEDSKERETRDEEESVKNEAPAVVDIKKEETVSESPASEESMTSGDESIKEGTDSDSAGSGSPDEKESGDEAPEETEEKAPSEEEKEESEGSGESGVEGRNERTLFGAAKAMILPVKAYAAEPEEDKEADEAEPSQEASEESKETEEDPGEEASEEKAPSEEPVSVEPVSEESTSEEAAAEDKPAAGEEASSEESSSEDKPKEEASVPSETEGPEKLAIGRPGTLENIRWRLDRELSAYNRFQAVKEGDEFVFVPSIRSSLKVECELPRIVVTITAEEEDTVSEDSVSEDEVEADISPAFSQMMVINGVRVFVEAPEGVFPEDSVLQVRKVDGGESRSIEEFVRSDMGLSDGEDSVSSNESGLSLQLVSFDISVRDVSGNEIQPDTEYGDARITFSGVDLIEDYLNAPGEETGGSLTSDEESGTRKSFRGYHFDDGLSVAETLQCDIDAGDSAATVRADHFSVYTLAAGSAETTGVPLDDCTITLSQEEYAYTGSEIMPSVSVTYEKKALKEFTDYTVSVSNNVAPASASDANAPQVTVTGMGGYTGSKVLKFTIKELPSGSITVAGKTWDGFQGKNETGVTIKSPQSVTIKATGVSSNTIKSVQYMISDTFYGSTKELDASALSWTAYNDTEKPQIVKDGTYYVYAKITDSGDNVLYLSSKKIIKKAGSADLKIEVLDHTYDVLQGVQEIDDYTDEMQKITITASGGKEIWYFITDKFFTSTSEIENEATNSKLTVGTTGTITTTSSSKWSKYDSNAKPGLLRNKLNYIYAKTTYLGSDGTETSVYVSSKGIWEDEKKPKVSSIATTPKATTAQVTVKGSDGESGIKYYYLQVKGKDDAAPKADDVKSGGEKTEDGKYDLSGLTAATQYMLYAVVTDKAGNISEVKSGKMTTQKATTSSADQKAKAAAAKAAAGGGAGGANKTSAGRSGSDSSGGTGSGSDKEKGKAGSGTGSGSDEEAATEEAVKTGVPYIRDATTGITIGKEKTSGWDNIEREVEKAVTPAEATIEMNGATVVPVKLLTDISDQDMTLSFLMNDDIIWTVNGLSFTEDVKGDIDFRVRKDTKNIPSQLVKEFSGVYPHTTLTLSHDGDFGFTAIMRINMGSQNAGLYANLYRYNEKKSGLDFVDSVLVSDGGNADLTFTHASDYMVVLRGDALTEKSAEALISRPTGTEAVSNVVSASNSIKMSSRIWILVISFISFALCGLILFLPDRKKARG